ncbi:MAG TPA: universal stress protein [Stenomitos sp.]
MPEGPTFETLCEVLKGIGVESYRAMDLGLATGMAQRVDTLLEVIDALGVAPEEVLSVLKAIRTRPESREVLLIVLLPADGGPSEPELLAAGASLVERHPLTPAVAYRMVARLLRRPRLSEVARDEVDPVEILRQRVAKTKGHHKIYFGAAPGVGKTYAMLREAQDRVSRGEDVVVGVVETHGRSETAQLVEGLEQVPRKDFDYKGTHLTEMDLEGILARKPAVVLVDELAHTNVPGSLNAKRYEDAQIIRMAGIAVISTINVQHIESLNGIIERITGVKVRETVPDTVLEDADEMVLVDISPEALQERLRAGKIYASDKITQSLSNFFTTHNLTALRELVLRELADKVEDKLDEVRAEIGKAEEPAGIQERILVCLTPSPGAQRLIRRGARLASRLNADLTVLYVEDGALRNDEQKALDQNFGLAESLEADVVMLRASEVGEAISQFASEHQVTAIVLGESRRSRLSAMIRTPILDTILHRTHNIDVIIVAATD